MSYAPESVVGEWTIGPRHESVFARIAEVWQYRHLLGYFATRSLQSMYKRSSLGWIWMIVRVVDPLCLTSIIFGGVLGVDPPGA